MDDKVLQWQNQTDWLTDWLTDWVLVTEWQTDKWANWLTNCWLTLSDWHCLADTVWSSRIATKPVKTAQVFNNFTIYTGFVGVFETETWASHSGNAAPWLPQPIFGLRKNSKNLASIEGWTTVDLKHSWLLLLSCIALHSMILPANCNFQGLHRHCAVEPCGQRFGAEGLLTKCTVLGHTWVADGLRHVMKFQVLLGLCTQHRSNATASEFKLVHLVFGAGPNSCPFKQWFLDSGKLRWGAMPKMNQSIHAHWFVEFCPATLCETRVRSLPYQTSAATFVDVGSGAKKVESLTCEICNFPKLHVLQQYAALFGYYILGCRFLMVLVLIRLCHWDS